MRLRFPVILIPASLILALISSSVPSQAQSGISAGKKCETVGKVYSKAQKRLICTELSSGLSWQPDTTSYLIGIWNSINRNTVMKSADDSLTSPIYSPLVDKKLANNILSSIKTASSFWRREIKVENPIPILFYTEKDTSWYQDELLELGLSTTEVEGRLLQVEDEIRRNGTRSNMAGMNRYHGISWMEFMIGTKQKLIDLNSVISGPHEWSHFAQYEIIGTENLEYAPCWFVEGSAEFYGMLLGASNEKMIISMRKRQLSEKYPKNFLGMRYEVPQGWEKFLEENGPPITNSRYNEDCGINGTYPVGAAATEFLYSLRGQQGILDFMRQIGVYKDFKDAFRAVYGINWSMGKKLIADYIRTIASHNKIN